MYKGTTTYQRNIAARAAISSTRTLIYQMVHDVFGFGLKRIDRLEACTERLTCDKNLSFSDIRNNLDRYTSEQLKRDYMRWIKPGVGPHGKVQRIGTEAGTEHIYTTMLWALHVEFGFGRERLLRAQEHLKMLASVIRDGEARIVDFEKCLNLELGIYFDTLEYFENTFGVIDLGPLVATDMGQKEA